MSRRKTEYLVLQGVLKCRLCKEIKPLSDFYKCKHMWHGRQTTCISCKAHPNPSRNNSYRSSNQLLREQGKRQCTKCHIVKDLSEFYPSVHSPHGKYSSCSECVRAIVLTRKCARYIRKPYIRKPYIRKFFCENNIQEIHYFSPEDFEEMLCFQNDKCAICKQYFKSSKTTHVDHCHKTNIVRGILCSGCNLGIGFINDNVEIIKNFLIYLVNHKCSKIDNKQNCPELDFKSRRKFQEENKKLKKKDLKRCIDCCIIKETNMYVYHAARKGFISRCNQCYALKNREKRYGINSLEFKQLLQTQNYKCATCFTEILESKKQEIDHCHECKIVRGVLCHSCNSSLGQFRDNINYIISALKYLQKENQNEQ